MRLHALSHRISAGWMLAGSAERQAGAQAEAAVRGVLTPICVEMFQRDTERVTKLKALREESTRHQAAYVVKQGWATMPGSDTPENRLAKVCDNQLLAANGSASTVER